MIILGSHKFRFQLTIEFSKPTTKNNKTDSLIASHKAQDQHAIQSLVSTATRNVATGRTVATARKATKDVAYTPMLLDDDDDSANRFIACHYGLAANKKQASVVSPTGKTGAPTVLMRLLFSLTK